MGDTRPIVAVNYYFGAKELGNRIFSESDHPSPTAPMMRAFRFFMAKRGVDVVTLDTVDFRDSNVKYVLYFDFNWRCVRSDPFWARVPREKLALILIEPPNINPSLYFVPWLRDRFATVFTWDLNLLSKNPSYTQINVPVGAEPANYLDNPFCDISFSDKRFLVAVSRNRWSYMPQSTYPIRKRAYRYFERACPSRFDLYGQGWNQPCGSFERWFGCPVFESWRGEIENSWDAKVRKLAEYRFALCFENNAAAPGYISEKMLDCLCARCVPVYYGSKGTENRIPRDAWIDLRDFRNFSDLHLFLDGIDEVAYAKYMRAVELFMASDQLAFFSTNHLFGVIADRLGFPSCLDDSTRDACASK